MRETGFRKSYRSSVKVPFLTYNASALPYNANSFGDQFWQAFPYNANSGNVAYNTIWATSRYTFNQRLEVNQNGITTRVMFNVYYDGSTFEVQSIDTATGGYASNHVSMPTSVSSADVG